MTFETFKSTILKTLRDYYGENYTLTIRTLPKNNQSSLEGLTIQEKGCNISPTIYLNHYYDNFKRGTSLYTIIEEIKNVYALNRPTESIDIRFFTDFNQVKNRICMKLIHYKKNEELLKEIPHIRYLDLAIVFYYLIHLVPGENATILIYNTHMKHWNTTSQALYTLAQKNTPLILPYYFDDIFSILEGYDTPDECPQQEQDSLYVLTNSEKLFGASTILYPNLIASLAQKLNHDLLIFPSSIHEVLILPVENTKHLPDYEHIINEVNQTHLTPEEILSDHSYYYNRKTDTIT